MIEINVNGKVKHCGPHPNARMHALWHFQPDSRGPKGHTFYESFGRSAQ
jgi:hypothetical protein